MTLYKRGKIWWVRITEGGCEVRRSLRTRDHREAEEKLAALEASRTRGGVSTMGALMAAWIAHKRIAHYQKPNSVKAYEVAARRFTKLWTDVPANDFPMQLIEQYKADQLLRGVSPTTVNLDVGLLENALRWGKRMGLLGRVPEITKVRQGERRKPPPNDRSRSGRSSSSGCDSSRSRSPPGRATGSPNRRRDSSKWEIRGDDLGAYLIRTEPDEAAHP